MIYVAIDYHKKYSQVEAINREGKVLGRARLVNEELTLERWFSSLGGGLGGGIGGLSKLAGHG